MSALLGIELSKEEEIFIISMVIALAGNKELTEENLLHELIKKAKEQEKQEELKRLLRKKMKKLEHTDHSYEQGFLDCASWVFDFIK